MDHYHPRDVQFSPVVLDYIGFRQGCRDYAGSFSEQRSQELVVYVESRSIRCAAKFAFCPSAHQREFCDRASKALSESGIAKFSDSVSDLLTRKIYRFLFYNLRRFVVHGLHAFL